MDFASYKNVILDIKYCIRVVYFSPIFTLFLKTITSMVEIRYTTQKTFHIFLLSALVSIKLIEPLRIFKFLSGHVYLLSTCNGVGSNQQYLESLPQKDVGFRRIFLKFSDIIMATE